MVQNILNNQLIELIVILMAGFLVGLEIKAHRIQKDAPKEIGSVRTVTFITLIGYIFAKIDTTIYIAAYIAIAIHFALFYFNKLKSGKSGIILFLVSTLSYSFGMIVVKFDIWFLIIIFVALIFLLSLNRKLEHFYTIFDEEEIETLTKLLMLSGVILPILPRDEIASFIPVSYFKVWLAVVVVSFFSYIGYILKKFVFKEKGYVITGILGGIYSSTATTIILAKKAASGSTPYLFVSATVIATALMYLRLTAISFAFNASIAAKLILPFGVLVFLSLLATYLFYRRSAKVGDGNSAGDSEDKNPLELSTAFTFAFLFILMASATHFILDEYGGMGLSILSFIVGFTDIDPFVLSILSSGFNVSAEEAAKAIIIAAGSNNILKAIYAYAFSKTRSGLMSAGVLTALGFATFLAILIV